MRENFNLFYNRFNQNEFNEPNSETEIQSFETKFQINFPTEYRLFLSTYGDLYTPDILDLVCDNELDLNDVQDFWKIEKIRYDKEKEWTSQLDIDLIPFASDCMGNIFGFKMEELRNKEQPEHIYFFDHDFDTIVKVSNSFVEWLDQYLKLD